MKSKPSGTPRPPPPSESEDVPALPVWKAFVVQFTRETSSQTGAFSGRIEHLSSGRRARFASTKELLATLGRMLDELGETAT
jgi:hypothetical protein